MSVKVKMMDKQDRIKVAYRAALVSGVFGGVVALLLILNFWHMKQNEPLESKTIEALVSRLSQEPNNEELKEEIRNFDLLARKAYFTSRWQVRTGAWLLFAAGIVMAAALKVYTSLRARIEPPGQVTEGLLRSRANSQYWLLLGGGAILGLALVAALLTSDYLGEYKAAAATGTSSEAGISEAGLPSTGTPSPGEGVELIEVFPQEGTAESDLSQPGISPSAPGQTAPSQTAPSQPGPAQPASSQAGPAGQAAAAAGGFNREDFRKNHATFRGYMGQGISLHKDIPVEWNGPSGKNIRWKVALTRSGFNSPVIWGDRLFISAGDNVARVVACYNRNTGQLLWERTVQDIPGSPATPPRVTDDTGLAAPTMAVDGKRVYAIFATGDVIAFDLEGNRVWARNLGVPANHYGHSSSLQVWGKYLVVQYDTNAKGRMLALNTASGETLWDVDRPVHISWASPALIEAGGKIQVVTTADPYVSGHDLETGAEVWKVEAMMGEVAPSIAYDNGLVFATNEYARLVALEPGKGAGFLWEDDEYLAEVSSPVAYQGLLYVATSYGVLVCYDARTGEKQWEKEFSEGFWSSPMIAEGKLYIFDVGGTAHILKADRTGTLLAEPGLGEAVFALPVFADGALYIRGIRNLYCIGN
jgi:outer membrane protein assembly factor BamB